MGNGGQYNIFKHRLDRLFSPSSTAGRIRDSNWGGRRIVRAMRDGFDGRIGA